MSEWHFYNNFSWSVNKNLLETPYFSLSGFSEEQTMCKDGSDLKYCWLCTVLYFVVIFAAIEMQMSPE